jgi:hypothetical protein
MKSIAGSLAQRHVNKTTDRFERYAALVDETCAPSVNLSISKISDDLLKKINEAILSGELAASKVLDLEDRKHDHLCLLTDEHSDQTERQLNSNLTVLPLHRFSSKNPLLGQIHREIRELFAADVGSPFVIVNSRMWVTHPNSIPHGPNAFHTDGFSAGHLKVMIYISALSVESGYFEFKNEEKTVQVRGLPAGTSILFKNSDIIHRGVPGSRYPRLSIEVTLMRSTVDHDQIWNGHYYGRHLIDPTIFHHYICSSDCIVEAFKNNIVRISSGIKVNIGSGKRDWEGWLCLDELQYPGVTNIVFGSQISMPLEDNSVSLFYSSHCFEHLDDKTLRQILREMYRSAKSNAIFVLKIPDYDYFLRQFKSGVSTSMNGKGTESVLDTWNGRLTDSFLNRLSMMFVGYWNAPYGDHFTGKIKRDNGAYHGPAIVDENSLRTIFETGSPRKIAETLCAIAKCDPEFSRFNHQNAWSRDEMVDFLRQSGFEVLSTSSSLIVERFRKHIPDIDQMQSWSGYYLAKRI